MRKKERFDEFIKYFSKAMPVAETELDYSSPFELIVSVILSAQCTDKRVNLITPPLFESLPDVSTMARASIEDIYQLIKSCSYPNNKAKHLLGMAQMLEADFGSIVPDNMEDLVKLPGVGRKTANVILSVAYNKPAMAVDTHVFRVAERIGLTKGAKTPYDAEMQLIKYLPEEIIPKAHHWLILHGRYTCQAKKPSCAECGISSICNFFMQQE